MSSTEPALVAGIDSSTQSATVVIRDADTGALRRFGSAPHPPGTEVDPHAWLDALQQAITMAGGLEDVSALSIGGQQHGMVALDADGERSEEHTSELQSRGHVVCRRLLEQ